MENYHRENIELKKRLLHFDEVIKMTQNLNSELQKKNENLEIENRTLEEEYHTMKDNYENLKKRFEQLQKEISEVKVNNSQKSSMFGWIINNSVKDENLKMREKISALEIELNLKIQENEQIHIEIFEEKQNFNKIANTLQSQIDLMKLEINDKLSEINSINLKNSALSNTQRTLEMSLNNISDSLKKAEQQFELKQSEWSTKEIAMKSEINKGEIIHNNLLKYNEYKDEDLNFYNLEYTFTHNFKQEFISKTFKSYSYLASVASSLLCFFDNFLNSLIERFNFIYSNVDLKAEHRGYLFSCDKLRFHSFTLSQIIRTALVFTKLLTKKLESIEDIISGKCKDISIETEVMSLTLNFNIILLLFNKSLVYFELIMKYFKVMLQEERKISYEEVVDSSIKLKINKDLILTWSSLSSCLKLIMNKVNMFCNFDNEFNLKHIEILSDNTSGVLVKVDKNYFVNYKWDCNLKTSKKHSFLESIFECDMPLAKAHFSSFTNNFILKSEIEYKVFEAIKEENKNKYNFPVINLSSLKANNENIKVTLNLIGDHLGKIKKNEIVDGLFITSWEFKNKLLIQQSLLLTRIDKSQLEWSELMKEYSTREQGVNYEEALSNKAVLKETQQKENLHFRDRENYLHKLEEYEEDIRRYKEKLDEQMNMNDIFKQSSDDVKDQGESEKDSNDINAFEEFLKRGVNISELQQDVLSEDVQSGKQRSSFKLSDPFNTIPLSKFTSQIETSQDVSVLYHRMVIEKLQRYSNIVKNFDVKVISSMRTENITKEYESKISEIKSELEDKINYLTLQLEQKENNIFGYTETIQFLSTSHTVLEELKDNIKDCIKCKKYILQ